MDRVGVIIVNWNSGELLGRCLAALAAQTRVPERVIVIDNASADGSLEAARQTFPRFEYIQNTGNTGFAAANNQAVEHCADCAWICLLNPDAFPEPDWLENLVRASVDHPGVAVFASLILRDDSAKLIDSAGDCYLRTGVALHRLMGGNAEQAMNTKPGEVFSASAAAAMYRREAFVTAGGFDAAYFTFYEDVDLGFRMRLLGYRCLLVPGAVVRHVGGGTTGGSGSVLSMYYGQRNFILTFFKDMPSPLLWRYLPGHLVAIARGIARGFRHGCGGPMLRATGAALAALPDCLRRRRAIQGRRKVGLKDLEEMFE